MRGSKYFSFSFYQTALLHFLLESSTYQFSSPLVKKKKKKKKTNTLKKGKGDEKKKRREYVGPELGVLKVTLNFVIQLNIFSSF